MQQSRRIKYLSNCTYNPDSSKVCSELFWNQSLLVARPADPFKVKADTWADCTYRAEHDGQTERVDEVSDEYKEIPRPNHKITYHIIRRKLILTADFKLAWLFFLATCGQHHKLKTQMTYYRLIKLMCLIYANIWTVAHLHIQQLQSNRTLPLDEVCVTW